MKKAVEERKLILSVYNRPMKAKAQIETVIMENGSFDRGDLINVPIKKDGHAINQILRMKKTKAYAW